MPMSETQNEVRQALTSIIKQITTDEKEVQTQVETYWKMLAAVHCTSMDAVKAMGQARLKDLGLTDGLASQLVAIAEKSAPLAFATLPTTNYPTSTPDLLQDRFKSPPSLPEEGGGGGGKATDLSSLTIQDWDSVMANCMALQGRKMKTLDARPEKVLIAPRTAAAVLDRTMPSQVGAAYSSGLSFAETFEKHAQTCDFGAFLKVSTPFVAASSEYKRQTDVANVRKGIALQQVYRYLVPVGEWLLRPHHEVLVDEKASIEEPFTVNPKLDQSFRKIMEIDIDMKNIPAVQHLLESIFEFWGDVVCTNVEFGLAMYSTQRMRCDTEQSVEVAKEALSVAVQGGSAFVKTESGGQWGTVSDSEVASLVKEEDRKWTVIGGMATGKKDDLNQARNEPTKWRGIHHKEFLPITHFLKRDVRERLAEWEEQIKKSKKAAPPPRPTQPVQHEEGTYYIRDNKGSYYHIDDGGYFTPGVKGEFSDMGGGILVESGTHRGKFMYASTDNGYICGYSSTVRTELSWTSGDAMYWYDHPVDVYNGYFYSSGRWYTHRDYKFTKEYKQSLPPQQETTKAVTSVHHEGTAYYIKDNKGSYYYIDDRGYFKPGKKGEFRDMRGGILVESGTHRGKFMYASADNGYICGYSSTVRTELSWISGGPMLWYNFPVDVYNGYFYSSGRWYTHRDYKFTKEYK